MGLSDCIYFSKNVLFRIYKAVIETVVALNLVTECQMLCHALYTHKVPFRVCMRCSGLNNSTNSSVNPSVSIRRLEFSAYFLPQIIGTSEWLKFPFSVRWLSRSFAVSSYTHIKILCVHNEAFFVIKIVHFICFIKCSKSSHWHARIYIQQTHVYFNGYNKVHLERHSLHTWLKQWF